MPHEDCPSDKHKAARINEGELEGVFDSGIEACAVIVADNRLRSVNESQERQNDNADNTVGNAEGRNRHVATGKRADRLDADVSVSGKAPGQNGVHQAVANLHHRRRQAQNINLAHVGGAQLHVAPANANWRALLDKELGDESGCHKLRADGGPGGALDSPMELHDEKVVKNNVSHGACDFAEHGRFGVTHRTDKVVHAGGDCLEHGAAQKNAHVAAGYGQCLVAGAEQLEERHHKDFTERERAECHQDQKREGIVQDNACLNVFLLAEADGEKCVTAHTHHHGHCHNEQANGEAQGNACDTETADALTHEETVHYVVEGVYQHADDGGNGKLQDQFRDAGSSEGIETLGIQT